MWQMSGRKKPSEFYQMLRDQELQAEKKAKQEVGILLQDRRN